MSFPHPLIYLRNSALAGLAGIVTGTVIHSIRASPEKGKKVLIFSSLSGCVGLGIGYSIGLVRRKNAYVYSLATGLNLLIVPLVFFGVRHVVKTGEALAVFIPKEKAVQFTFDTPYELSVCSGSITGFLTSLYAIKRSFKSTLISMIVGGLLAGSGQFTYDVFDKWRINRAMRIYYPELFPKGKELTWDEWLGDLLMRKRKLGRLDDKIVELEKELEVLEKEEAELFQEFSNKEES